MIRLRIILGLFVRGPDWGPGIIGWRNLGRGGLRRLRGGLGPILLWIMLWRLGSLGLRLSNCCLINLSIALEMPQFTLHYHNLGSFLIFNNLSSIKTKSSTLSCVAQSKYSHQVINHINLEFTKWDKIKLKGPMTIA